MLMQALGGSLPWQLLRSHLIPPQTPSRLHRTFPICENSNFQQISNFSRNKMKIHEAAKMVHTGRWKFKGVGQTSSDLHLVSCPSKTPRKVPKRLTSKFGKTLSTLKLNKFFIHKFYIAWILRMLMYLVVLISDITNLKTDKEYKSFDMKLQLPQFVLYSRLVAL